MAKKHKVFQTSLGFFDLAIAAPSMRAALEAWGADSNLFHQGAARESEDPDVVAAAMSKPGVILRRPVGSDGPFTEDAGLPSYLSRDASNQKRPPARVKPRKQPRREADNKATREAALAFEKKRRFRESERRNQEAARERERERRQNTIAKAQAALDKAEREHDRRAAAIDVERARLLKRSEVENDRWGKQKDKLATALRRARD